MDQNVRWSLEVERLSIERLSFAPSASAQRLNENFYAEAAKIHRGPQRKPIRYATFWQSYAETFRERSVLPRISIIMSDPAANKTLPNVRYVFAFCMPVTSLPIDTIGTGT